MDESGFTLSKANVAIIGLGLMGGSLALSLKNKCGQLSAFDTHLPTLEIARQRKIVDLASDDPTAVLAQANVVILACPVHAILEWIERLPEFIQQPCIVLDIGSTKRTILRAFQALPTYFDPIGGHPICGKERLSLRNAENNLYHDAPFILTRLTRTSVNAQGAARQITEAIGANPIWLTAEDHDKFLAYTSHLPYLLSAALALTPPNEAKPFIGPGFRSTSRLAGTPLSMILDVLVSNRDNILPAVHQIQAQLSMLETALENNHPDQLQTILESARDQYHMLID
ncbi:prephenate dehydrogenase [bacterium]|nr:prephenate dehydrogenase [bacterium]